MGDNKIGSWKLPFSIFIVTSLHIINYKQFVLWFYLKWHSLRLTTAEYRWICLTWNCSSAHSIFHLQFSLLYRNERKGGRGRKVMSLWWFCTDWRSLLKCARSELAHWNRIFKASELGVPFLVKLLYFNFFY